MTSRALIAIQPQPQPRRPSRARSSLSTLSLSTFRDGVNSPELWQPILHSSELNQVVLYNPRSHALSITSAQVDVDHDREEVMVAHPHRSMMIAAPAESCPYCKQILPDGFHAELPLGPETQVTEDEEYESLSTDPAYHSRASDYFQLLAIANQTTSTASGSGSSLSQSIGSERREESRERSRGRSNGARSTSRNGHAAFPPERMAEGYFKTFFQEEYRLGMGANGTVYLCQHVLDGNPLGHFAVKKIAVGESHSYLLKTLREVKLLELLHHPNIITYHHSWLETAQFSSFGPKVPTLHVLMQWAEGGSLDDFIDVRLGRKPAHIHMHPAFSPFATVPPSPASVTEELPAEEPAGEDGSIEPSTPKDRAHFSLHPSSHPQRPQPHATSRPEDPHSRSARIRAFRAFQRAPPEEKERLRHDMDAASFKETGKSAKARAQEQEWTAIHLLSADEVKSLFQDVVEGLRFLHSRSILHLDLKPGNVLLTWDEGRLIPRAMLSDFGTSRDMIKTSKLQRSGNTGTLEYTAPESLPAPHTGLLQQVDSKTDMWSLGMILHKLLFFKLPYRYASVGDANGEPISRDDEGEKMDRLEKEVLAYPGFKSTSALIEGFEARRLPRAFLVLLENLLHKIPVSRPSVERVATAIREGKLDPLADAPATNLPLARSRTTENSTPTPPNISGSGTTERGSQHVPDKAQQQLLVLPSLAQSVDIIDENSRDDPGQPPRLANRLGVSIRSSTITTSLKLLRSSLLVLKVLTIPYLCPDTNSPRPFISTFLLALAIADTVLDYRPSPSTQEPSQTPTHSPSLAHQRHHTRQAADSNIWWTAMGGLWVTLALALLHFGFVALSLWSPVWRSVCCGSGVLDFQTFEHLRGD